MSKEETRHENQQKQDTRQPKNSAQPEQQSGSINTTTDEDILTNNLKENKDSRDNQENERPDGELRK